MKCFNCGNSVPPEKEKCGNCNIPVKYYGLMPETIEKIQEDEISGKLCNNCNGIQNSLNVLSCQFCNFPFSDQKQLENNSLEERGLATHDGEQNFYPENTSENVESKIFNLKTKGYKNRIL